MSEAAIVVDCGHGLLHGFGRTWRCVVGRGGAVPAAAKREGDGTTPLGCWPIRSALIRPGTGFAAPAGLPWRWLRRSDGWCDAPADPSYNRPVVHPHARSAEHLWRDDAAYDVILVLGHNDRPPVPGLGSAIFWHLAQPDWRPTEGCIAVSREAMAALLPQLRAGMALWCMAGADQPLP